MSMQQYDAQYPLYGVAFSHSPVHPNRIALTSYSTAPTNRISIVDTFDDLGASSPTASTSSSSGYQHLASANLHLPATKVAWEPRESLPQHDVHGGGRGELLATSGDVLRLWEVNEGAAAAGYDDGSGYVGRGGGWQNGGGGYAVSVRGVLTNSKQPPMGLPPITSLSWNAVAPSSIVTCSIDTTATLWDITSQTAVTQLIAHDKAVYDLSWLPDSSDIFVSVGADGSLRAFDLRTLEHSTILYESAAETPLARIAFSNREQHMLACFGMDDSKVLILDMRSPGQPVAELVGHQAPLGGIAWGAGGAGGGEGESSGGGWIASCGDDSQVLLYDLSGPLPPPDSSSKTSQSKAAAAASANRPSRPSPNPMSAYSLSPPTTPAATINRSTPSPGLASEILPTKAWTAESEINNLAFSDEGDRLACVNGSKLTVLAV